MKEEKTWIIAVWCSGNMLPSSEWTTTMITTTSLNNGHSPGKSLRFACLVWFPQLSMAHFLLLAVSLFSSLIRSTTHVILTTFDKTLRGDILSFKNHDCLSTTRRRLICAFYWIKARALKSQIALAFLFDFLWHCSGHHFSAHLPIRSPNNFCTSCEKTKTRVRQKKKEERKKESETLVGPPTVSHC